VLQPKIQVLLTGLDGKLFVSLPLEDPGSRRSVARWIFPIERQIVWVVPGDGHHPQELLAQVAAEHRAELRPPRVAGREQGVAVDAEAQLELGHDVLDEGNILGAADLIRCGAILPARGGRTVGERLHARVGVDEQGPVIRHRLEPVLLSGTQARAVAPVKAKHDRIAPPLVVSPGHDYVKAALIARRIERYAVNALRPGAPAAFWRVQIDAPQWGQDIDMLQLTAAELLAADPEKNLIFSAHFWWPRSMRSDDPGSTRRIKTELNESAEMNLPLVIGEFAPCRRWLSALYRLPRDHRRGPTARHWLARLVLGPR
jgi:hypothetical protein